jgi:hypothetical protein
VPERLGLAAGLGLYADELPAGNGGFFISQAAALHWRPDGGVTVTPFWSRIDGIDREAAPIFVSGTDPLPPRDRRRAFLGPDWTDARTVSTNYGPVSRGRFGQWDTALGVFRSIQENRTGFVDLIRGIEAAGNAPNYVRAAARAELDQRRSPDRPQLRGRRPPAQPDARAPRARSPQRVWRRRHRRLRPAAFRRRLRYAGAGLFVRATNTRTGAPMDARSRLRPALARARIAATGRAAHCLSQAHLPARRRQHADP